MRLPSTQHAIPHLFAAGALALLSSTANAQLTPVQPFQGEIQESFDALGDPTNVECIQGGIFGGQATMCTPGVSKMRVTPLWNNQCVMSGVNGLGSFAGSTSGAIEITFVTPVARFGAYFGTHATVKNSDIHFYDESGNLIASEFLPYENDCNWNWFGWETVGTLKIGKVVLDGTHPNDGFVLIDNVEANTTANFFKGDPPFLSWQTGGTYTMNLFAGQDLAGLPYLVLGSATGDAPGFPLDGQTLPLIIDPYFIYTLTTPNQGPYANTFGTLDSLGNASATLTMPAGLPPSVIGQTLWHAYTVIELTPTLLSVVLASNSIRLEIGL